MTPITPRQKFRFKKLLRSKMSFDLRRNIRLVVGVKSGSPALAALNAVTALRISCGMNGLVSGMPG